MFPSVWFYFPQQLPGQVLFSSFSGYRKTKWLSPKCYCWSVDETMKHLPDDTDSFKNKHSCSFMMFLRNKKLCHIPSSPCLYCTPPTAHSWRLEENIRGYFEDSDVTEIRSLNPDSTVMGYVWVFFFFSHIALNKNPGATSHVMMDYFK